LGDGGAIQIPGPGAVINQDGSLQIQVPGQAQAITVGRLQVARFTDTKGLEPVGGTRFKLKDGGAQPTVVEAFLEPMSVEMSNVSAVTGMIDLIQTNRAFDAYSKAAQSLDTLNQSAITQVGKRAS
jgi:flagellar basal-body rod protein FlgG